MNMNTDLNNAYLEVLQENLDAIIKQNFLFQAQLKVNEKISDRKIELENLLNEQASIINNLNDKLAQMELYKSRSEQNTQVHEEKNRIQSALNDVMQQLNAVNTQLSEKENKINSLNSIISDLETKLKTVESKYKTELDSMTEKNNFLVAEQQKYIALLEDNIGATKLKKLKTDNIPKQDGSSF